MGEPERVAAQVVYSKVNAGMALLVCAYDSDEKFHNVHLDGAISLADFRGRVPSLDKSQEIFFYCA
jgi:hypothetical protein